MNCQEIREELNGALDNQRSITSQTNNPRHAEVLLHVESCSDCRLHYEEHLLIATVLAAWAPQRTAVDLTDRVIDVVRREGLVSSNGSAVTGTKMGDADLQEGRSESDADVVVRSGPYETLPQGRKIWPTIITVALVLMTFAIVSREKLGTIAVNDHLQEQVVSEQPAEFFQQPQDQIADVSHLVADARSAWQGITSRVSHQASGFSVFVPDIKHELGIPDAPNPAVDSGDASDDVVPQKSSEPSTVEKAFEFLFKDGDLSGTLTIQVKVVCSNTPIRVNATLSGYGSQRKSASTTKWFI
jgi:hypothetical protein